MKTTTRLLACAATLALASSGLLACTRGGGATPGEVTPGPAPSEGQVGADATGPDPTDASLSAARGPYAVSQARGNGSGFASGTVYYPSDTSLGKLGAIVVVPGFLSAESSVSWWGPRIASHGFVVMTIGTNTVTDFPASRSSQQNAALRWLTTSSPVANRIDPSRLGAQGWSMGGGGSLMTGQSNPNVKVIVGMAPWNPGSQYRYSKPTFILSCNADTIAGNGQNSNIFYSSLQGPKAQLTIGGSHFCPTTPNASAGKFVVAWLKRYLDGDERYSRFICASAPMGTTYRNSGAC
jgi:dienelactone hydrolase